MYFEEKQGWCMYMTISMCCWCPLVEAVLGSGRNNSISLNSTIYLGVGVAFAAKKNYVSCS